MMSEDVKNMIIGAFSQAVNAASEKGILTDENIRLVAENIGWRENVPKMNNDGENVLDENGDIVFEPNQIHYAAYIPIHFVNDVSLRYLKEAKKKQTEKAINEQINQQIS